HAVATGSVRHLRDTNRVAATAQPRAARLAHRVALVAVENAADVCQRVVGHVDQVAVARLAKYIAPIVAVGPELGVFEREIDAPENGEAKEVALPDDGGDDDH